ncbi:glutamate racemase [Lacticaseibacillus hulanensis]|uniref:glutamate racemase n=1 Tax=Lacticaseibacillus hulanensis TaxID=2493111 RepID=UPI000FDB646D|nr:glutamate racemase [Lacticaseibacillus hulanensis]
MKEAPIGFIDSGVGGLTVVKEALRQLPHENVIFLGDQARLPYGPRPAEQVVQFTWQMTNFMRKKGIKMLVIACNTATAAALDTLKEHLDIPVVGVIVPGSRAAVKATGTGRIGVIATEGTVRSDAYAKALHRRNENLSVTSLAAPKFVPVVESNEYADPIAERVVSETLKPMVAANVDTLVMGCTHYPLLRPFIQETMGKNVKLIDSGAETVSEVSVLLDYFDMANPQTKTGTREFYTTGHPAMFKTIAADWLGLDNLTAQHVTITGEADHYVEDFAENGQTVVVASTNKGKVSEIAKFFAKRGIAVKSLADFPNVATVDETGTTFEENAKLKAHGYSEQLGLPVLADDSGLMVDALDGAPGVFSARYAGDAHNDAANNAKLLAELGGTPREKRTAHFKTTLVLSHPGRTQDDVVAEGSVDGVIGIVPEGDNGFGYDPFFFLPELGKTMAQLTTEEKNRISHRGNALRALGAKLDALK